MENNLKFYTMGTNFRLSLVVAACCFYGPARLCPRLFHFINRLTQQQATRIGQSTKLNNAGSVWESDPQAEATL